MRASCRRASRAISSPQMNADVAVVVAEADGAIAGYLCGSSVEFNRRFALLAAMIERYPQIEWRRRPLDRYAELRVRPGMRRSTVSRQRYVARLVSARCCRAVAGRFEVGVAFVAQDNPRSLAAHVQGLGMDDVADFEFNERRYRILAFAVERDMP